MAGAGRGSGAAVSAGSAPALLLGVSRGHFRVVLQLQLNYGSISRVVPLHDSAALGALIPMNEFVSYPPSHTPVSTGPT